MGRLAFLNPETQIREELIPDNSYRLGGQLPSYYVPHEGKVTITAAQWTYNTLKEFISEPIEIPDFVITPSTVVDVLWNPVISTFLTDNNINTVQFYNDNGIIKCRIFKNDDKQTISGDVTLDVRYYQTGIPASEGAGAGENDYGNEVFIGPGQAPIGTKIQIDTEGAEPVISVYDATGHRITIPALKGEHGVSGVQMSETEPQDPEVQVWLRPDHTSSTGEVIQEQVRLAQQAAVDAEASKTSAESAKDMAQGYMTIADKAAEAARTAQDKAEETLTKAPRINDVGYWEIWSPVSSSYVQTANKSNPESKGDYNAEALYNPLDIVYSDKEKTSYIAVKANKGVPVSDTSTWHVLAAGFSGHNFTILGTYPTLQALKENVIDPAPGDAYDIGTQPPYSIYIYDKVLNDWNDNGTIADTLTSYIKGESDPTTATSAEIGQRYINTLTGDWFTCTTIIDGAFVWTKGQNAEAGKGLSTNDFTNEDKAKLAKINAEGFAPQEEIKNILLDGFIDGTKTFSADGTTITAIAKDKRKLTKKFTNNFNTITATLENSEGVKLAELVKEFSPDGTLITSTVTYY